MALKSISERYPIVVEHCKPIANSGGPGRHRGGLGLELKLRATSPIAIAFTLIGDELGGIEGGMDGVATDALQFRDGMIRFYLETSGRCTAELLRNDALMLRVAGGGGHGLSLDRPIEAVVCDLRAGHISAQAALFYYGVIVDTESIELDIPATLKHRATLKAAMQLPREARDSIVTGITQEAMARTQPEHWVLQCMLPGCCAPRIPFLSGERSPRFR
ncbi:MAG: hydantoinase B/oxoprolinase family protein [Burkholderiales bacterium]